MVPAGTSGEAGAPRLATPASTARPNAATKRIRRIHIAPLQTSSIAAGSERQSGPQNHDFSLRDRDDPLGGLSRLEGVPAQRMIRGTPWGGVLILSHITSCSHRRRNAPPRLRSTTGEVIPHGYTDAESGRGRLLAHSGTPLTSPTSAIPSRSDEERLHDAWPRRTRGRA